VVDEEKFLREFRELANSARDSIDILYMIIPKEHGIILVSEDGEWIYKITCERNIAKHCPHFKPASSGESHD